MCMTQYGSAGVPAAAGAIDMLTAVAAAAAAGFIDADRRRPVCIISQQSYRVTSIYLRSS